jgi:small subunit ribosomal protein S7
MSRRHRADKREIIPDPKFGDMVLTKFMNSIMKEGKKSAAERIVYGALDQMESKAKQNPIEMFHQALQNVMPALEVRSRRVGGATYQVPVEVRLDRRQALAIRWIISAARGRNENTMVERLSGELLDAVNNRGTAVKKREDTHPWRRRTAPSRITAGKQFKDFYDGPSYTPRGLPQYRDHGAYRRRQDHDHRACALLHG